MYADYLLISMSGAVPVSPNDLIFGYSLNKLSQQGYFRGLNFDQIVPKTINKASKAHFI